MISFSLNMEPTLSLPALCISRICFSLLPIPRAFQQIVKYFPEDPRPGSTGFSSHIHRGAFYYKVTVGEWVVVVC